MNCLDYRRGLLADPSRRSAEALSHQRSCAACDAFSRQLGADESLLGEAMNVAVPEGMADRVLLRNSLEGANRIRSRRHRLLAIASSLLLALGAVLTIGLLSQPVSTEQLVVQHIRNELDHLHEQGDLRLEQVNAVLEPFDSELDAGLGTVHYAGACKIRREPGAHLVISGERGPVTILLMPEEGVRDRMPIRDERFSGVVIPTGNGSMAIVGEVDERLDVIEQRIARSLRIQS